MGDSSDLVNQLRATLGKMEVALGAIVEAIAWTDNDCKVQWSNAAFDRLVGLNRFQILGARLIDLLPLEQQTQKIPSSAHPASLALQGHKGTERYDFARADKKLVLEISWASMQLKEHRTSAVLAIEDITVRQQEEEELRQHRQRLQELVEERTAELKATNQLLWREISSRQAALTEREWAEKELQESETRFRQLAENINEVFWLSDPKKFKILYISPAYEQIWGRTPQSLYEQPKSFVDAIHPEDRERTRAALGKQLFGEPTEETYRIVKPDGEVRWIRDRSFPIFDKSGQLYRVAGIAEDITQYKQAEAETRKALEKEKELNEMKSRFISMTSHEFRTPLTTILSATNLVQHYGHKLPESEKQELFGQIETGIKRLTLLLDNLLFLTKAEADKVQFKPVPLELEKFCGALVKEMQLIDGGKHTINFVSNGDCTGAVMDENLLRHVLSNLLSNAIKYTPPGGDIQFKLDREDKEVIFQIKDSGIGIPPEDLQRLFESFHRASNVGNIPGTGLGLAIVQRMVNLHRGSIGVDSEVGFGTTFTVTIPFNTA